MERKVTCPLKGNRQLVPSLTGTWRTEGRPDSLVSSDRLQALPAPCVPDTDEAILSPADQVPVAMEFQASDRACGKTKTDSLCYMYSRLQLQCRASHRPFVTE